MNVKKCVGIEITMVPDRPDLKDYIKIYGKDYWNQQVTGLRDMMEKSDAPEKVEVLIRYPDGTEKEYKFEYLLEMCLEIKEVMKPIARKR